MPRKKYETFVCRRADNGEFMKCICGLCDAERLRGYLAEAVSLLRQGKAQFSPHTTNSLVDEFIAKHSKDAAK